MYLLLADPGGGRGEARRMPRTYDIFMPQNAKFPQFLSLAIH